MESADLIRDPSFKVEFQDWCSQLRTFDSISEVKRSSWYRARGMRLNQFLGRAYGENINVARPEKKRWIRCVSWNIEKGKRFAELLRAFQTDARLKLADVIFLQEADLGMARSENRFVARELARALSMNYAFSPCFIELTKGVGDDLDAPGKNQLGLQGNAILSRFPLKSAESIQLPQCFEPFECEEKRWGRRTALWCELEVEGHHFIAISAHLEVRNTPKCRARQVQHLLNTVTLRSTNQMLIGGDFNSNTFARGTAWRTLRGFLRMARATPEAMLASTLHPENREPLFSAFQRFEFEWNSLNDRKPSSASRLRSLEDLRFIPRPLRNRVIATLDDFGGSLPLRLDWFVGRGVSVAKRDRIQTENAEPPLGALTLDVLADELQSRQISDHHPIVVDIGLESAFPPRDTLGESP